MFQLSKSVIFCGGPYSPEEYFKLLKKYDPTASNELFSSETEVITIHDNDILLNGSDVSFNISSYSNLSDWFISENISCIFRKTTGNNWEILIEKKNIEKVYEKFKNDRNYKLEITCNSIFQVGIMTLDLCEKAKNKIRINEDWTYRKQYSSNKIIIYTKTKETLVLIRLLL